MKAELDRMEEAGVIKRILNLFEGMKNVETSMANIVFGKLILNHIYKRNKNSILIDEKQGNWNY